MVHYLKKLEEQIRLHGDKPALCDYNGSSWTYAELAEQIAQFHLFFKAAGIRKGDRIALCGRSSARWGIFFLAINTYEAVVVPILANFTPEGVEKLVHHSECILMITDPDIWKRMNAKNLPLLAGVLSTKADALLWARGPKLKQAWSGRKKAFAQFYPAGFQPAIVHYPGDNGGDLAIINYTSGTSGDPKGVMLTYDAMSDIVEYCQQHISREADVLVSMLPLAHMYGLAMEFIYPCVTGFTIYFLGKTPSPSLLLQSLQDIRPSLVVTVPLIMEKVYRNVVAPVLNSRSAKAMRAVPGLRSSFYKSVGKKLMKDFGGRVEQIIIGGAPLNWDVESGYRKIGLPYVVGYGLTECCPLLSLERPESFVPGSCGKPIHEIRIDSSDPEHVPGEIQAKGPNLFIGYLKNPAADEAAHTEDGWFRTGDLGIMDEGGNLFIRGRIKALILSASGQNIYPEEVEQVVLRHPAVEEALVLDKGGKVIALVYPKADALPVLDEEHVQKMALDIRDEANKHLPIFSQIFQVEMVEHPFERTAKGSIKRHLYQ